MSAVSVSKIEKELKELHDYFSSDVDAMVGLSASPVSEITAEEWQRYLPNISPKALHRSLIALKIGKDVPKVKLEFGLAKMVIDFGQGIEMTLKTEKNALHIENVDVPKQFAGKHYATRMMDWVATLATTTERIGLSMTASKDGAYAWAKLGFYPSRGGWRELKRQIAECRLNGDHTRIAFEADTLSPYQAGCKHIDFALKPDETAIIDRVLGSNTPEDLWLISDLSRELGTVELTPGKTHKVTVAKALLSGLRWSAELRLAKDNPGCQRFSEYVDTHAGGKKAATYAESVGKKDKPLATERNRSALPKNRGDDAPRL